MKMRLMKKCLRAARINRLIQPIACALADDKPLEMDRDACMRVLEAAHPDTGQSAIWAERLPTQGKSKIQLDVIVPAYNAEATLTECINSVLEQQTQYEFRLIVVDDGSTDGTAALADTFAARENVLVLHQQDGGVAEPRATTEPAQRRTLSDVRGRGRPTCAGRNRAADGLRCRGGRGYRGGRLFQFQSGLSARPSA